MNLKGLKSLFDVKGSLKEFGKILFSLAFAFIIGAIVLLMMGANPLSVYQAIFAMALGSFDMVLRRATVLMLAGLAVAIPVKTGMFNMGGEGQIVAGGFVAAVIASLPLPIPGFLHILLAICAAAFVGAALAALPAVLKVKRGASEVVTTLMINSIVSYIVTWLVLNPFRGAEYSPQTAQIQSSTHIPLFMGMKFSWALFVSIALCILFQWIILKTSFGLQVRSAGLNPSMAKYQRVNIKMMGIIGMVIGGALAAAGGAFEVLGGQHMYQNECFSGYGFDGIAIAYMAGNNPVGVIVTSIIVSMIRTGALSVSRRTGISIYFVTFLQGLIVLLLVCPRFINVLGEPLKKIFRKRREK